ncbi:MAG: methyltransferase domain-containing protein [Planctomycetes bacterium]|nr:methyltransferase domain-containing protein [Planctomycetota bacterium]
MAIAETTTGGVLCELIRCPICRGDLELTEQGWQCQNVVCGEIHATVDGVPILLNERNSVFEAATFLDRQPTFFKPRGRVRALFSDWLPTIDRNVAARRVLSRLREMLLEDCLQPTVLVLGGGILGEGMEVMAREQRVDLIETDVSLGPRTRVICDAHDLPFADACFDAVIVQATLEHVVDPVECVAEIERVLKPNGLVYADTPFMQQVHGREYDFTRFTRLGHRRLFRNFAEVESGISVGPGTALAWSLRYFLLSFCRSRAARGIASGLARLAFSWLKTFDRHLAGKPGACDAASAFYFLGRKTNAALSDRDLIAGYRGGF